MIKKLDVCLSLCQYRRILLTAELIGFSLTGQLLIGPRKVYSYFGGGYHNPTPKKSTKIKKMPSRGHFLQLAKNITNTIFLVIS